MSQQVYRRISNPYMPNGTPDKTNSPSPYYAPGEVGYAFADQNSGGEYLRAQLDSGAYSGSAVGAVLQGQLAFWKDQDNGIVTNDPNQCDLGPSAAINRVAGIFQLAVTATPNVKGSDGLPVMYMCDLVIKKRAYNVRATGTFIAGGQVLADTTANQSRAVCGAAVNTAPISQVLGVATTATITNNVTPVNVFIGFAE
jgi:hypothetical protein